MQQQTTLENPDLAAVEVQGMTRASFVLRGALAAGALYGASAVTPFVSQAFAAETGDVAILNFALTLEYLESDFYNVKGRQVGLSGEAKTYAHLFGEQEAEHVKALTAAIKQLGGKPAAKPTFTFPATNQKSFLTLASTLENTGVSAYNGAGPSLKSKKLLAAAGSIVQIEGRHAATVDLMIAKSPTPDGAFDKPFTEAHVLTLVKPLIK
ncbi:MAG: ferritin-like domain-containing protein [Solirubrobacteraceae bacterium]